MLGKGLKLTSTGATAVEHVLVEDLLEVHHVGHFVGIHAARVFSTGREDPGRCRLQSNDRRLQGRGEVMLDYSSRWSGRGNCGWMLHGVRFLVDFVGESTGGAGEVRGECCGWCRFVDTNAGAGRCS